MSDGGKGDKRRPKQISDEEFTEKWERIFKKAYDSDKNVEDVLKEMIQINQETGQYDDK